MAQNAFAQLFSGLASPSTTPKKSFIDSFAASSPTMFQTPKPVQTGANPGATATTQTKITTPTTSPATSMNAKLGIGASYPGGSTALNSTLKTPPAQQYMSSLAQTPQYQSTVSEPPVSIGSIRSGPMEPISQPQTQQKPKVSAFDEYLASLKPSDDVINATKALGDVRSQVAGKELQARRQFEETLDRDFGTVSGAREAAQLTSRRNNSELADLAVRENALANTLSALTAAGASQGEIAKARFDYEKFLAENQPEGFTLGKDQVRYDAQGNPIAGGASSGNTFGESYTAGTNPTVDAYVSAVRNNTTKLENVPEEIRGLVAQGVTSALGGSDPKKQYVKSQADEALINIDTALGILSGETAGAVNTAGGPIRRAVFGLVPGSDVANLNASLDTVKALVGFDALQKMRESSPTGGALGQITERELAFLQSVQGSLNTNQGTEQLVKTINRIKESFQTLQLVNSPDGTPFELEGKTYIKQGDKLVPQGFSSVGGDTNQASKIVDGYDIGSYATDPNHEKRVASIYNQVRTINTAPQADNYIRQVAPNSPVKGQDVVAAAQAYGVSVPMILAIMQQDSTFGTKGLAVRTRNPGNVGNDDSGATRTYPTFRDGVFAVAENLSRRKVA